MTHIEAMWPPPQVSETFRMCRDQCRVIGAEAQDFESWVEDVKRK